LTRLGRTSIAFLLSAGYDLHMRIARLVREARRAAGFTQRELSARAGVPQSTVGRIEAGHIAPRWSTVEALLDATGMTVELAATAGAGVDRSQIRELLRLTPLQRARLAAADAAGLSRALGDGRR
jgi:transcriptional regulator with XRE-family HTH domain